MSSAEDFESDQPILVPSTIQELVATQEVRQEELAARVVHRLGELSIQPELMNVREFHSLHFANGAERFVLLLSQSSRESKLPMLRITTNDYEYSADGSAKVTISDFGLLADTAQLVSSTRGILTRQPKGKWSKDPSVGPRLIKRQDKVTRIKTAGYVLRGRTPGTVAKGREPALQLLDRVEALTALSGILDTLGFGTIEDHIELGHL